MSTKQLPFINPLIFMSAFLLGMLFFSSTLSSCKKEAHKEPYLRFFADSGYTYKDTILNLGQPIHIGFGAIKPTDGATLSSYQLKRQINHTAETIIDHSLLISSQGDTMSREYSFIPGAASGDTVSYTFSVSTSNSWSAQLVLHAYTR